MTNPHPYPTTTGAELDAEYLAHLQSLTLGYAAAMDSAADRATEADRIGDQLATLANDLRGTARPVSAPDDVDGPFETWASPSSRRSVDNAADLIELRARDAWGQGGAWRLVRECLGKRLAEVQAETEGATR